MHSLLVKYQEVSELLSEIGVNPILYGSLGVALYVGEFKKIGDIDLLIEDQWIKERWPEFLKFMNEHGFELGDEHEHEFRDKDGVVVNFSFQGILLKDNVGDPRKDSVLISRDGIEIKTLSKETFIKAYQYSSNDGYRKEKRGKNDLEIVKRLEDV